MIAHKNFASGSYFWLGTILWNADAKMFTWSWDSLVLLLRLGARGLIAQLNGQVYDHLSYQFRESSMGFGEGVSILQNKVYVLNWWHMYGTGQTWNAWVWESRDRDSIDPSHQYSQWSTCAMCTSCSHKRTLCQVEYLEIMLPPGDIVRFLLNFRVLVLEAQQANKWVTVLSGVINHDHVKELEFLLHHEGERRTNMGWFTGHLTVHLW